MSTVAPARDEWFTAVIGGAAYWIADCGCLAFAFLAVGSPVPWQGLLLAYCAAQLAVNLPITPGGLGVVEGSLTVALVAFGGGRAPTVAAVLLYRVISFWLPLPTGAGCYVALARGRRRRERALRDSAAAAAPPPGLPTEAGPDLVPVDLAGGASGVVASGRDVNRSISAGGRPGNGPVAGMNNDGARGAGASGAGANTAEAGADSAGTGTTGTAGSTRGFGPRAGTEDK